MISIFKNIFRALRYRNFRLFFLGQGISVTGTWMQQIAMGWLTYRITNSPLLLGVVGFASQIPLFVLSPFAGVISDRLNRRRLIIITQVLSMIQALILAFLTMTGTVAVWHILVLGIFLGCVNSFDIPARQAFIVEMVEGKESLANAIALNSFMFNAARLIGPTIAGIIIGIAGEGMCFFINGISFIAAIWALYSMRLKKRKIEPRHPDMLTELKEGVVYAYRFLPIKAILMLLSAISLLGMSYVVLMPVFAKDVLKGGPGTFGLMMAFAGVGALIATVYLASRKNIAQLAAMIPVYASIFSIGLIALAFSRVTALSLFVLVFTGFGIMAHMASSNIILQTVVDDDKRGRVMSLYATAFIGVTPFGSLLAGSVASAIGATNTLIASGVICVIASAVFWSRTPELVRLIQPICRKMEAGNDVVSGIGTATNLAVPPED